MPIVISSSEELNVKHRAMLAPNRIDIFYFPPQEGTIINNSYKLKSVTPTEKKVFPICPAFSFVRHCLSAKIELRQRETRERRPDEKIYNKVGGQFFKARPHVATMVATDTQRRRELCVRARACVCPK